MKCSYRCRQSLQEAIPWAGGRSVRVWRENVDPSDLRRVLIRGYRRSSRPPDCGHLGWRAAGTRHAATLRAGTSRTTGGIKWHISSTILACRLATPVLPLATIVQLLVFRNRTLLKWPNASGRTWTARIFAASHPLLWLATVVLWRKFACYARRYATPALLSAASISTNTASDARKPVGAAQKNAALWRNKPGFDCGLAAEKRMQSETRTARRDVTRYGRRQDSRLAQSAVAALKSASQGDRRVAVMVSEDAG